MAEQEKTTVYRIEAHLSAGNTGDPMVSAVARAVGNFLFRKPLETQVLTFVAAGEHQLKADLGACVRTVMRTLEELNEHAG